MFNYLFYLSLAVLCLISILFLQPRCLLAILASLIPGVVYFAKTDQPLIALTIDDGPDAITTPKILSILEQYEVRATFFE